MFKRVTRLFQEGINIVMLIKIMDGKKINS